MFDEVLKGAPFRETWEDLFELAPALRGQSIILLELLPHALLKAIALIPLTFKLPSKINSIHLAMIQLVTRLLL